MKVFLYFFHYLVTNPIRKTTYSRIPKKSSRTYITLVNLYSQINVIKVNLHEFIIKMPKVSINNVKKESVYGKFVKWKAINFAYFFLKFCIFCYPIK